MKHVIMLHCVVIHNTLFNVIMVRNRCLWMDVEVEGIVGAAKNLTCFVKSKYVQNKHLVFGWKWAKSNPKQVSMTIFFRIILPIFTKFRKEIQWLFPVRRVHLPNSSWKSEKIKCIFLVIIFGYRNIDWMIMFSLKNKGSNRQFKKKRRERVKAIACFKNEVQWCAIILLF